MSTITKEWLQQTIAEMEEHRDLFPGDLDDNHENVLAALRIALASLEAEPVAWMWERDGKRDVDMDNPHDGVNRIGAKKAMDAGWKCSPLYTAPQVPVSVPDDSAITQHFDTIALETAREIMCDVSRRHEFLGGEVQLLSRIQCRIDDACRAAMLQGAEPVTTGYKLRDAVETIRNSGIAIDAERIFAERDALNAPDCWCRTCRPITLTDMRFVVCPECGNKRCPHANDHRIACTGSNEPGQEGSAYPAAPQQEVK